jgi:hypothetical protein
MVLANNSLEFPLCSEIFDVAGGTQNNRVSTNFRVVGAYTLGGLTAPWAQWHFLTELSFSSGLRTPAVSQSLSHRFSLNNDNAAAME